MRTLLALTLTGMSFGQAVPPTPPSPTQPPSVVDREISWKRLAPNLIEDQKHIWSLPARLVRGQDLVPFAAVLGTTGALLTLDPHEGSYFRNTTAFQGFNKVFGSTQTAVGTALLPASFYVAGLIRSDSKMKGTALLAGEAVADAEILATVMKDASKRARPTDIGLNGNYWDTWWDNPGNALHGTGSFPSGHSIAAFSVATVFSRRYGKTHRWVPYAAYGLAGLVGFSRLTLSAHFVSDVFMGGALGYTIGRFSVLRQ
jgi:membrane-associated phospholipid phosphatase